MSRAHPRRALIILTASLAIAGCGGEPTPSPPATAPTVDQTAPRTSAAPSPQRRPEGGASEGRGRPSNSPREAEADFEKYCETHPGACAD